LAKKLSGRGEKSAGQRLPQLEATWVETLEMVDRPNIGFQADMSHTFLYHLGLQCTLAQNTSQGCGFGMIGKAIEAA